MVVRPSKRPMPWSACTTRSPTPRLVASVMTSEALRALAARPHEAVAEDVLLADDGEVGGLEALLEPQHGERRGIGGQRGRLTEVLDLVGIGEMVLAQQRQQPLARAWRERGDDDPLALGLQRAHMLGRRIEHVGALPGALEREVASHPATEGVDPAVLAIAPLAADRGSDRETGFGHALTLGGGRCARRWRETTTRGAHRRE